MRARNLVKTVYLRNQFDSKKVQMAIIQCRALKGSFFSPTIRTFFFKSAKRNTSFRMITLAYVSGNYAKHCNIKWSPLVCVWNRFPTGAQPKHYTVEVQNCVQQTAGVLGFARGAPDRS